MVSLSFAPNITYHKRYKMEVALALAAPPPPLPPGYAFVPWDEALLETHGETLYQCFVDELDSQVFPSLGHRAGCRLLMGEIRRKVGFLPQATWLLACPGGYCGTVQGVRERNGMGAIQNLGIVRAHRGRGLGRALLLQALAGFRQVGLTQAMLEVTARNEGAVRLYQHAGFRKRKTLYKAVDTAAAALALVPEV